MKISANFKELDKSKLIKHYDLSRRRLILLDYEGTLPSSNNHTLFEYQSKGLSPSSKILNTLDYLTKDKRNIIFIITGREAKLVSEWFSPVPDLGLASEHGLLYRYSTNVKAKDKWEKMIKNFNGEWRSYCVEQLEPYTERCEGSFIEVKEASVVWQYRDCDPELGKSFAQVITSDFENSLKNLKLKVINGKGYVEVKPEGINKGAFASYILKQEIKRKRVPDFILAIGDDTADEEMFKYFNTKKPEIIKYSKKCNIYTVTVGKKPSSAECYVDSTSDVRAILEAFMQISNRKAMSSSTINIRALGNVFNDLSTTLSNDKTHGIVDENFSDKDSDS
jgi:trehalose 6-phosphate synthase/phosphatase